MDIQISVMRMWEENSEGMAVEYACTGAILKVGVGDRIIQLGYVVFKGSDLLQG